MKNKLKNIAVLLFLVSSVSGCRIENNTIVSRQLFDLNWKFYPGEHIFASEPAFADQHWRSLDLPHDWSKDCPTDFSSAPPDSGESASGWYRKQFEIPEKWHDKTISIQFEGIQAVTGIFVNGTRLDGMPAGSTSFSTVISPFLDRNGLNVISIRVTVPKLPGGNWPAPSGIFSHVWLIVEDTPVQNNRNFSIFSRSSSLN